MLFAEDLRECLKVLKEGGVILYPTDTVWGLGCDPASPGAVKKIFGIKSRSHDKSLIILVNGIQMLERYVSEVPEIVYQLTEVSDDPLTIIYPRGKNLAGGVCADDGTVAIRICNDDFCNELITRFRKPVVSTSANPSGKPAPANFSEIERSVIDAADYTVKYRRDDKKRYSASPVIKVERNGVFSIIRK